MPDFDKDLKPILKNPDTELPQIDNPAVSGHRAFTNSVKTLGQTNLSLTEQVFGRPLRSDMPSTVSEKELHDNRRYGIYNAETQDIEDQKAYAQSDWDKATNGVLKGLNLTATTVAGGFSMLYGIGKSTVSGRLADIWDNEGSRALDAWNNKVDQEYLPNYETNIEKDAKWYSSDYWFKTNFLFDTLIKNSGFAVGAMLSGNVINAGALRLGAKVGTLLGAAAEASEGFKLFTPLLRNTARAFSKAKNIEAAQELEKGLSSIADITERSSELARIAKTTNILGSIADKTRRSTIALYSSAGEASWEALSTQNEMRERLMSQYKEATGQEATGEALKDIEAKVEKVGLTSFLGNIALLALTEYVQLPKLMGSSYSAERQAANSLMGQAGEVLIRDGQYVSKAGLEVPKSIFGRASRFAVKAGKFVFDPKEAGQEIGQYALQIGSQNYYDKAFKNNDASVWTDGFLYGMFDEEKGALESKEGIVGGITGGITGGLMQGRQNNLQAKTVRSNTQMFASMLTDSPSAKTAFKDKLLSANRGITLQEEQQLEVVSGNKLGAKNLESDILFNYLSTRIKYGRYDMVKEDLSDIRQQLNSGEGGLASLKEEGLFNINDTVQTALEKLDTIEKTANNLSEIYKSLNLRYSGAIDEDGRRLYSSSVIEKMAYVAFKITDFDNRMISLAPILVKGGINTLMVEDAVVDRESTEDFVKKQEQEIDKLNILSDDKLGIKETFADYVELAILRKQMLQEYDDIKQKPTQYNPSNDRDVEEEAETITRDIDDNTVKNTVKLDTEVGEREFEIGKEYLLGKVVEYDKNGNEVYRFPSLTILGENENGTIKVRASNGVEKDISKEDLKDYRLIDPAKVAANKTAKYFMEHVNDIFQFNFGKSSKDGKRRGRISYDPENNDLYFVYKNHKNEVKSLPLNRKHFIAQEGFNEPLIKKVGVLTAVQKQAAKDYAEEQLTEDEQRKESLAASGDLRMSIITTLSKDSSEKLAEVKKKVVDKVDQLKKINEELDSLREQAAPKASDSLKSRTQKYLEDTKYGKKFAKVFSVTSKAITRLSRLKQSVEEELADLTAEQEELEFNLAYFQDLSINLAEFPENDKDFLNELKQQVGWIEELIKESGEEINTLAALSKDIDKAIKELVSFLKDAFKSFDAEYPSYLKDSFDRILASGTVLTEMPILKQYLVDFALLEDTQKEISFRESDIKKIEEDVAAVYSRLEDLGKQLNAKETILKTYEQRIKEHQEAKEAEDRLREDKELQQKFFNNQTAVDNNSGEETQSPEDVALEKEVKTLNDARKPIEIVYEASIVSSDSTRESDLRHEEFMEIIDMLPAQKRDRIKRIYISSSNEEAAGLKGITAEHLSYNGGYTEKGLDDRLMLAVYVHVDEDGSFSYIDKNGNPTSKAGEQADLSKIIWVSMPAATKSTEGYGIRFNEKATDKEIDAYLNQYKAFREQVFAQVDEVFPPHDFFVSNGIIKTEPNGRNPIVGNLITEDQLDTGAQLLQVSTLGTVSHQGRSINVKKGRLYISNGGTLRPVSNRNLTNKEVDTVFAVLKQFVAEANKTKVFNSTMVGYLQGILYFRSPYKKEGDVETKSNVGRNQFYFRGGNFYFGKNEVEIPFTVNALEAREKEVKAFLKGTYNNVNTFLLKKNDRYTEYVMNVKGELETREWPTYQHYLLSSKGRKAEEVPIYTNVVNRLPDVEGDRRFDKGSRYTYGHSAVPQSLNAPVVTPAPAAQVTPTQSVETPVVTVSSDLEQMLLDAKAEFDVKVAKVTAAIPNEDLADFQIGLLKMEYNKKVKEIKKKGSVSATPVKEEAKATIVEPLKEHIQEKEGEKEAVAPTAKGAEAISELKPEEKAVVKQTADQLMEAMLKFNAEGNDEYRKATRLALGVADYSLADVEAEKEYIEKNTPFTVEIFKGLIEAGNGLFAFGTYMNSIVELSDAAEVGTGYHEMFEGVYDVFLTTKEKKKLLKEFASREGTFTDRETGVTLKYSEATPAQAKEQMAEEFRDKKLFNFDPPKSKTSFIKSFLQKLVDIYNWLLNKDNVRNLQQLFSRMDSAYYKNAPYKSAPTLVKQYRKDIGLDAKDTYTVVKSVVGRVMQELFADNKIKVLNELDFSKFTDEEVYQKVYDGLFRYFSVNLLNEVNRGKMTLDQYKTTILPVFAAIHTNWPTVKELAGEMLKTYGIVQEMEEDKEGEDSDYGGRNSDSYTLSHFVYDGKKNAPASIKLLIATISESTFQATQTVKFGKREVGEPDVVTDPSTGLEQMVNFSQTFNFILKELAQHNTLAQKEEHIRNLAYTHPNMARLYHRLGLGDATRSLDQWALNIKFYNTFSKQKPEPLITYIQEDGSIVTGAADLQSTVDILSQNFLAQLKSSSYVHIEKGQFVLNATGIKTKNTPEGHLSYLRHLGLDFTPQQVGNLGATGIIKLGEEVAGLKGVLSQKKLDASTLKTLGIEGRMLAIFEMYIQSQALDPESTFINLEGQRVQSSTQTNAVSRIVNDINSAKNKKALLEELTHLKGDYSSDSVYVNQQIYNADGEKKGDSLLFKIKYIMGMIDKSDNNEPTPIDKMHKIDRLLQGINQNLIGNYYVLLPADSQTEFMLEMKNIYAGLTPDALNQLYKYYQNEQRLEGKSTNRIFKFLKNGLSEAKFKEEITAFVNNEVEMQKKDLLDFNMMYENGGVYSWRSLDSNYAQRKSYDKLNMSEADVRAILTERTVNFMTNNIEIQKIFFGDPAFYKDATRRYKSFLSPREQSLYNSPEFDAVANEVFNKVGDIQLVRGIPGYQTFRNFLRTVTMRDNSVALDYLKSYNDINSTDAQGISTLPAYKQMRIKNGYRWSEGDEKQYQYEMALDRLQMAEDVALTGFSYDNPALKRADEKLIAKGDPRSATFSPLKPIVSGFSDTRPILDKYSIAPITYNATRGKVMATQYKRMLDNDVDYFIFESGRKVGGIEKDSFYDEEGNVKTDMYNPNAMLDVPFKWFGIQVETLATKTSQTWGSQLAKLATVNLINSGLPTDYKGTYDAWYTMTPQEKENASPVYKLVMREKALREEMTQNGLQQLLKKVGINNDGTVDSKKFLALIKDELTRRDLNSNLRDALEIDEATQNFKIPLEALTNYEQIKNIVFSYVDKYIAHPKLNGGPKIQVSGSGWEVNGKKIVAKKIVNKETGETKTIYVSSGLKFYTKEDPYMEILLPAWFGKKLRDAGVDLANVKIEDIDPKILTGIGFRIPTQELNSVEVFRVAGFLPESMGDMVVVPEAITTKAGSDFDVDKLNTYLKNVYVTKDGKLKLVPFFGFGVEARTKLVLLDMLETSVRPDGDAIDKLEEEDFNVEETLYKQSLENEYFSVLEEILTLPQNFERMTEPNSSEELKELRDILVGISEEEFGEGAIQSIVSPTYMNTIRHNYILGKGGVGIAAVAQVHAALSQKGPIFVDPDRIVNLKDKNEAVYVGDGSVNLPVNTVTIKGKKYVSLSGDKDKVGRYISDKISQFINGFVDVAKDAFLTQLGVNRNNASLFLLLERMGVPTDVTVLFMNQPIIREYNKILAREKKSYPFNTPLLKMALDMFPSAATSKYDLSKPNEAAEILKDNLVSYYKTGKADNGFQQQILEDYLKYSVMANNMYRLVQASNYDTAKFTSPHAINRKLWQTEQAESNNILSSVENIMENTMMGKVKDALVTATDKISNSFFKFLSDGVKEYFMPVAEEFAGQRISDNDYVRIARKVEQSFIEYLQQNEDGLNARIQELLVDSETALAREIESLRSSFMKNNFSAIANNLIIKSLRDDNIIEPLDTKVVRLFDRSKDVFSQDMFIAAMQELKANPLTEKLYDNLIRTALLQSGIGMTPISFIDIIPVEDYKKLIEPALKGLTNIELLRNFRRSDAFYRNNWADNQIVPVVKKKWKTKKNPYTGQDEAYVSNQYYNKSLTALAQSKGKDTTLHAYRVYQAQQQISSRFIKIPTMLDKNKKGILLLRRVDDPQGKPLMQSFKIGEDEVFYAVYVAVNGWGDSFKAKEYYQYPRQSVLNNRTVKINNEMSNDELYKALSQNVVTKAAYSTPNRTEFDKLPAKSSRPTMTYAGIGSRKTPPAILAEMTKVASELEKKGYTLNTGITFGGRKEGADAAFDKGATKKNLFAPEKAGKREMAIAQEIHPNPSALKEGGLKLMARNTNQVFGEKLDTPVDFVLFYAKETSNPLRPEGGTGQAVEMARRKGIPTINMAEENWRGQLNTVLESKATNSQSIEIVGRYTDAEVKANRNKVYVFGDNTERKGTGGQAQIRNNPNAMGIATKLQPSNSPEAFMTDKDLAKNKQIIDSDIVKIKATGKPLVFPKDGFGTGLAKLKEKAPQTYAYLKDRLIEEFGFNNDFGIIVKKDFPQAELNVQNNDNPPFMTREEIEEYNKKCK